MTPALQLATTTATYTISRVAGYQLANKVFGANINPKAYATYLAFSTVTSLAFNILSSQTLTQLEMMQRSSNGLKTSTALATCITILTISITAPFLTKWAAQKASGQPLYWKHIIGANILGSAVAFVGALALGASEILPKHQNFREAN